MIALNKLLPLYTQHAAAFQHPIRSFSSPKFNCLFDFPPIFDALIDRQLASFHKHADFVLSSRVERIWFDRSFGVALNLPNAPERLHQAAAFQQLFQFHILGWHVCIVTALSVYLYRYQVRCVATCSATIVLFSKVNLMRTHS